MTSSRIRSMARGRNRAIAFEAAIEAGTGIVFWAIALGFVFWVTWLIAFFARPFGLGPTGTALIVVGVYALVTGVAAWRRVEPLVGVRPLTEAEYRLTLVSIAAPYFVYFSPRHASAGAAMLLLGGPANIFAAFGTWRHRLRFDDGVVERAAALLADCGEGVMADAVHAPDAAVLLHRLALVKVVTDGDTVVVRRTRKGEDVLGAAADRP